MGEAHILVDNLVSVWWITLAAVVGPLLAITTRRQIPDVVWLLTLGLLVGPHGLGLARTTQSVEFLRELGIGFLFLLAGFEVNPVDMRGRQGRHAAATWFLCAAMGFGAGLLVARGDWKVAVVVAVASTSTALGTILPIVKDSGWLEAPLGRAIMVHGAFGELLPIVAMSLLLSTRGTTRAALVLVLFAAVAVLAIALPARLLHRVPLLGRAFRGASNSTMQTTLRFTVWALVTLMLLSAVLGLDVALGAFAAGLLLNAVLMAEAPDHGVEMRHKIEIVGFSLLVPVFFVTSGMNLDVRAMLAQWPLLPGFVLVLACVRGLPVFLRERLTPTHSNLESPRQEAALGLYAATGLPIIVAVTQIAEASGLISVTIGSIMVTGGALTVLLFPFLAQRLTDGERPLPDDGASTPVVLPVGSAVV